MPLTDIKVFDSTMRDGEQQPMLSFRDDEKIALCYQLEKLGIYEIDLMPSIDEHERILIRLLNNTRLRERLGAATMVHRKYVDQAVAVNAKAAYVFVHVSDPLMQARGKTREQNTVDIIDCIGYARQQGLIVDFCGGDGTRADTGYLTELLTEIGPLIRHYQPCDTSGLMTPEKSVKHVKMLTDILGEKIVVHYHNDNGQAAQSVIAALHAGAIGFDGTFLGIGERAGNVATEEVLYKLRDTEGIEIEGIDYQQIEPTVEMVRRMCRGVEPPSTNLERRYPNVSGIHAKALLGKRDAFDFEYTPDAVETMLFFGKHSGRSNYMLLFDGQKTEEECAGIRDEVKRLSREQLKDFTATEIREMFG
jgi:benzylmalate synthase